MVRTLFGGDCRIETTPVAVRERPDVDGELVTIVSDDQLTYLIRGRADHQLPSTISLAAGKGNVGHLCRQKLHQPFKVHGDVHAMTFPADWKRTSAPGRRNFPTPPLPVRNWHFVADPLDQWSANGPAPAFTNLEFSDSLLSDCIFDIRRELLH